MKILKNKKGSAVVETIMLFPVLMYLILFSFYKVVAYAEHSSIYKEASEYARIVIVYDTPQDMMDALAREMYDPTQKTKTKTKSSLTRISVMPKGGTIANKVSVEFDNYGHGSSTFASFCKIESGITRFDYDRWINKNKSMLEEVWDVGALVEIEIQKDLATDLMENVTSFYVWDFNSNKRVELTFGVETKLKASASNVLSM